MSESILEAMGHEEEESAAGEDLRLCVVLLMMMIDMFVQSAIGFQSLTTVLVSLHKFTLTSLVKTGMRFLTNG